MRARENKYWPHAGETAIFCNSLGVTIVDVQGFGSAGHCTTWLTGIR